MIYIVDFGSQVTQLIARRVREVGVYCEIVSNKNLLNKIKDINPTGIIFSGGPASVHKSRTPKINQKIFSLNIPILGICYGMQLIVHQLGGKVEISNKREFGKTLITHIDKSILFQSIKLKNKQHYVWMSHGDKAIKLPNDFITVAKSKNSKFVCIENKKLKIYGLQFHPEVVHTHQGEKIIKNFIINVCKSKPTWSMQSYLKTQVAKIKIKVEKHQVICGLSGGVDSMVTAAIISKAIGKQLTCIYVDTGLMRLNETKEVQKLFKKYFKSRLVTVNAKNKFLNSLRGISDPEKKRKIIGNLFIKIFNAESKKISKAKFLAQGTIYPDIIESKSFHGGPTSVIKSHHNVGGLPKKMQLELVEPLQELFKDEVRRLGKELKLPKEFIQRHPFPGPGLGIRVLGDITKEKVQILQQADKIYIDEIKAANLYNEIWQAFAVLLPVRTVGVMGDQRSYEFVCSLRAVTSVDGMTADFYPFSSQFLSIVSTRIINEVKGINRVVYDTTSKPPGTIEWE
ncbi:glutamine-hydrolyzing GMP synthase [Pelagibacteraceae bacterium]|nr:glutamine-hydrolyzing GMP synthase [Pelagibacteraceae bacterium]